MISNGAGAPASLRKSDYRRKAALYTPNPGGSGAQPSPVTAANLEDACLSQINARPVILILPLWIREMSHLKSSLGKQNG